jgi:hypothetical protein
MDELSRQTVFLPSMSVLCDSFEMLDHVAFIRLSGMKIQHVPQFNKRGT